MKDSDAEITGKVYGILHSTGTQDLTNEDIKVAIRTLKPMVKTLRAMGAHFHLAWLRLYESLDTLEGFKKARAEHARDERAAARERARRRIR